MARFRFFSNLRAASTCVAIFALAGMPRASAQNPQQVPLREPALWARPIKLHAVWAQIIDLCRDTPFDSPDAALAAAKLAGLQPAGGNKTVEAAVAIFNRAILPDLAMFDRSLFALEPNLPLRRIDWRGGRSVRRPSRARRPRRGGPGRRPRRSR